MWCGKKPDKSNMVIFEGSISPTNTDELRKKRVSKSQVPLMCSPNEIYDTDERKVFLSYVVLEPEIDEILEESLSNRTG